MVGGSNFLFKNDHLDFFSLSAVYIIYKAADCLLPLLALRELIALKAMRLIVSLRHALEFLPTVFRVYSEHRTF